MSETNGRAATDIGGTARIYRKGRWSKAEERLLTKMVTEYHGKNGPKRVTGRAYEHWAGVFHRQPTAIAYKINAMGLGYRNLVNKKNDPALFTYTPTTLELPPDWVKTASDLAEQLNAQGTLAAFGRLDSAIVLRLAIHKGLQMIEAEVNE